MFSCNKGARMVAPTCGGVSFPLSRPWWIGRHARFSVPACSLKNMTLRRNLAGFSDLALNEAIKVSFKHHRLFWRQLDALKFARSEQLIDGGLLKAKPATKFR